MTKKHDEIIGMRARSAFSEKFKFEQEFEKVISKTNNPEKLFYLRFHCFLEICFIC